MVIKAVIQVIHVNSMAVNFVKNYRMNNSLYPLILAFNVFALTLCSAQQKTYDAQIIDTPPTIDGFLDEEVWKNSAVGGDFIQFFPTDSLAAKHPTTFQLAYTNTTLYVA